MLNQYKINVKILAACVWHWRQGRELFKWIKVLRRWQSCTRKFGFINGVDNVNWPPYIDSTSVSSVSPSSERIDEVDSLWRRTKDQISGEGIGNVREVRVRGRGVQLRGEGLSFSLPPHSPQFGCIPDPLLFPTSPMQTTSVQNCRNCFLFSCHFKRFFKLSFYTFLIQWGISSQLCILLLCHTFRFVSINAAILVVANQKGH